MLQEREGWVIVSMNRGSRLGFIEAEVRRPDIITDPRTATAAIVPQQPEVRLQVREVGTNVLR